jgi:hypothetical protein
VAANPECTVPSCSMEQRNPLNQELETLQKLQAAAGA